MPGHRNSRLAACGISTWAQISPPPGSLSALGFPHLSFQFLHFFRTWAGTAEIPAGYRGDRPGPAERWPSSRPGRPGRLKTRPPSHGAVERVGLASPGAESSTLGTGQGEPLPDSHPLARRTRQPSPADAIRVEFSSKPTGSGAFDTREPGVGRRRTVHQEPRDGESPLTHPWRAHRPDLRTGTAAGELIAAFLVPRIAGVAMVQGLGLVSLAEQCNR
jgi:hypothetical protein